MPLQFSSLGSTNTHMNSSNRTSLSDTQFSSSSSLDGSIGSATINGPIRVGNSDGDMCSYHPLVEGESCQKPRTCYECLNVEVVGVHDGCLLAPSGFCEHMSSFEASMDYRRNTSAENLSLTGWYNFFPSINTTYCEPKDDACQLCNKLVNNGSLSRSAQTPNVSDEVKRQFCTGTLGCVCVMACEAVNWEANMPMECDAGGKIPGEKKDLSSTTNHSIMLIVYLVLQVAIIALIMYKRGLCRRPRPQPEGPNNNITVISSPSNRLRLSGWKRMQNLLIEREKKQHSDHSQCSASPRDDCISTEVEDRSLTGHSSSFQILTLDSDAAYTQVHDDLEFVRSCAQKQSGLEAQSVSIDNDVVVVGGTFEDSKSNCGVLRTVRASSMVAMLEPRRNAL